jgi:DNA-binding MarR family transcriptional regulator/GNAT superfamily N-acetyltransferase
MSTASMLPRSSSDDAIPSVRRFNRFYTRHIGILNEYLLESQLSLTEVRVLYELAQRDKVTAIELREELGLDRGYLSRMLQGFRKLGWITTTPSRADRRCVLLSLTNKGRRVFLPLDRRSSEEVRAMLEQLSDSEQQRLLAAMHEIQEILSHHSRRELLTAEPAGLVPRTQKKKAATGPGGDETSYILRAPRPGDMDWVVERHGELYAQEYHYDERFEALVAEIVAEFVENFDAKHERSWIAEKNGQRMGTIFLVKQSRTVAKLRLLLVEPGARGLGIGRRLVSECIEFARHAGYKKIVLWTQSELHAARHLYEQSGFHRIAQKPHQSWGRTDLVAETWELRL